VKLNRARAVTKIALIYKIITSIITISAKALIINLLIFIKLLASLKVIVYNKAVIFNKSY
jgi:hypothetical protein